MAAVHCRNDLTSVFHEKSAIIAVVMFRQTQLPSNASECRAVNYYRAAARLALTVSATALLPPEGIGSFQALHQFTQTEYPGVFGYQHTLDKDFYHR